MESAERLLDRGLIDHCRVSRLEGPIGDFFIIDGSLGSWLAGGRSGSPRTALTQEKRLTEKTKGGVETQSTE
jgi:hypothetical protein